MAAVNAECTELASIAAELLDLSRASRLHNWDQETTMPPGGAIYRARVQSTLQGLAHERLTRPRVGELLDRLGDPATAETLSPTEAALVRLMRREYDRAVKLPNSFVRELAQAASEGVEIWRRARHESRFVDFAPALDHIVHLKREEAEMIGFTAHPYDALLDRYEPGLTVGQLTPLFTSLRQATVELLNRLRGSTVRPDGAFLSAQYDLARQWEFGEWLVGQIGFDLTAGRIDRSTHPFAAGLAPGDVRLTTRMSANELTMGIFGNLHEGGHGLYEQGLDSTLATNIVGQSASLGIHESQSRLWENFIGRGIPFWRHAFPRLQATFPEQLRGVTVEQFVLAANQVQPSLIRVEADEVTYNLHIILRYEIERQLLERTIRVKDLPEVWNTLMVDYLGLTPPNDREGVLQDTHWAVAYFGYFPTYTLGNLYAAQLWGSIRQALPDLDAQLAAGDCRPLLDWLREHIHRLGRLYQPTDLLARATGQPPEPHHLISYLNDKFGRLYGLA